MGDVQSGEFTLGYTDAEKLLISEFAEEKRKLIERRVNDKGGVKADGLKKRPTLLLKSCNKAVDSIIDVLEYGAKKYSADNWKKVERERYLDAAYRHMLAYTKGDVNDPETNMPHLAHAMCCLLFMLQMDLDKDAKEN